MLAAAKSAEEVYREFFVASSLFILATTALLIWVCRQVCRQGNREFLRQWAACWSVYLVARSISLLQLTVFFDRGQDALTLSLSIASQVGYYLHVVLLVACLIGLVRRDARPIGRRWLLVWLLVAIVVSVAATWVSVDSRALRMGLRVALRCGLTSVGFLVCGAMVLRHGIRGGAFSARFIGIALLLGTVHQGVHAYAFGTGSIYTLAIYLAGLELLAVAAIGFGLLLWGQEDVNEQAQRVNRELGERTSELLHAQRLESVGQLAGGVAHDFNNVLTVILGNTEQLLKDPRLSGDVRDGLEEMRYAAMQAAKLTGQLLSLARNPASAMRTIDVAREAEDNLPLLRCLVGVGIDVELAIAERPLHARLKRGHVEQVLINLVTNGRDAIAGAGSIRVWTGRRRIDGEGRVVLSATDTGCGVPEAMRDRVGELFFTTKHGSGTGMGMASVRSILTETGGRMSIDAGPQGLGTCVTVSWPEAEVSADVRLAAADAQPALPPSAPATIALAEDDAAVRAVAARALSSAGFRVLTRNTSAEVGDLLRSSDEQVDLLLSDIIMPGMSGPELARLARETRPDLAVCFVSGFVDDYATVQLPADTRVLGKPFTRDELITFVTSVLAAAAGDRAGGCQRG